MGKISIKDVATMLGTTSYSLKGLCTSSRINKWSVRKPIAHSKLSDLSDAEVLAADGGLVYGASVLSPYMTASALLTEAKSGKQWTYTPPTGAYPGQPWRLGDFRGYVHRAGAWMTAQLDGDITLDALTRTVRFTFGGMDSVSGADGALSWRQCATWRDCYACVCCFDSAGVLQWYVTTAETIGESAADLTLTFGTGGIALTANKTYTYLKCACTVCHPTATAVSEGTPRYVAIPCEGRAYGTLTYGEGVVSMTATVDRIAGGTAVPTAWAKPEDYNGVVEVGAEPSRYALGGSGSLWLRVTLDSSASTTAVTFAALSVIASATLGGATDALGAATIYLYNADGTLSPMPSSGVTVAARSRRTLALYVGALMTTRRDGSTGTADAGATCTTTFRLRLGSGATMTASPGGIRFEV